MLFWPMQEMQDAVKNMPKEFFEVYLYLIERGVSHDAADRAAHEAWASGFKKQASEQK